MSEFRSRKSLVSFVRSQTLNNVDLAINNLMIVYNNQTNDEQAANETHYRNRMGFNYADARILSRIAKSVIDNKSLDDSQLIEIKTRMPKYARQIVKSKIASGTLVKSNGVYIY
jgi:hypothetical protein